MESTIESLQAVSELVDPTGGKDQLRMAVKALSARVEDIEAQGMSFFIEKGISQPTLV
jgi:hypothetical protein